jgi:hypothetical protein
LVARFVDIGGIANWYLKYVELLHSGNTFCEEDLWKGQSLGRMPF